ncbi:MAG: hypothetical protein ACN2B6_09740 [Rickettsiales bacterium]
MALNKHQEDRLLLKRYAVNIAFFALYVLCTLWAAISLMSSSHMGDSWRGATLPAMVEGTAERPYVYRVLMPITVKTIVALTPGTIEHTVNDALARQDYSWLPPDRRMQRAMANTKTLYMRLVAMSLMLGCMASFTVAMYKLGRQLYKDNPVIARCVPLVALAMVPPLAGRVAYIYDASTLALTAACFYALYTAKWRWYYVWFVLACLNKESALFVALMFAIWQFGRMEHKQLLTHLTTQFMTLALVKIVTGYVFASNVGVFLKTDYQTWQLDVLWSIYHWQTYLLLLAGAFLLFFRFREKPVFARKGLWVVGLMWVSYMLFGKPGEYRVFFEAVPIIALLATHTLAVTTNMCGMRRRINDT